MFEKFRQVLCLPEGSVLAQTGTQEDTRAGCPGVIYWFDEMDEAFDVVATHGVWEAADKSECEDFDLTVIA